CARGVPEGFDYW
nr:immunoglobulin heavy chain junction region [Mus musculus]NSM06386.1 immunoglobulin heavy chain junction region [Mus musculus]